MKTVLIVGLVLALFVVIGLALSEGIGHLIAAHIFSVL